MSQETDRYTLLGDGHEVLSVELQLDSRGNVIAIPPGLNFNLMGSMTILPGHEPLYMWWHRSQKLFTGPDPMWRDLLADEDLEGQMELESRAIADAARSEDGRGGIAAFLAKEKPSFRGR